LAEALGAKSLWLIGYTATPENPKVSKSAMGCEKQVPWKTLAELSELKKINPVRVIGLEINENSKSIYEDFVNGPTILVVGNERFGLGPKTLACCDEVRHIPMSGFKNSLNVSQALSIAAFEWKRQHLQKDLAAKKQSN
jgi:tRNA (guanosine-2'-O-)-methyltransferase